MFLALGSSGGRNMSVKPGRATWEVLGHPGLVYLRNKEKKSEAKQKYQMHRRTCAHMCVRNVSWLRHLVYLYQIVIEVVLSSRTMVFRGSTWRNHWKTSCTRT